MKFGHRIHGTITEYDDRGRGTLELSGGRKQVPIEGNPDETRGTYMLGTGTVAIPFSAKGDDLVATFMRRDQGTKIAKIEEIVTPSPDRTHAPCPHAGVCGGCLWQHLSYEAQLRLKRDMINRAYERAGHAERVAEVMASPDQLYYRNRMDYTVGWLGTLGLKEYGSWNRYLDLSTCFLLSKDTASILEAGRSLMREHGMEPWDAKHHTGLMRYLVIREGKNTQQRLILVVVSSLERVDEASRRAIHDLLSPFCTSLLLGEQPKITDLSYVTRTETLKGDPWLEENVNDIHYRIAPNSFFQTNTHMAERLQQHVVSLVASCAPTSLLDLYCGLGFFGIAAAKRLPKLRVSGYELDDEAIRLATHNATVNGVAEQTTFSSGPAEDLSWKDTVADTIIIDPPRAGLHPRVIQTLLEKKAQNLIYISCNYHRLVEELKEFKTAYSVASVTALDLFPQTPHVEVVTRLQRK